MYGNDCAEKCSMTCGDPGVCDKVTGHCNGSCLPGWEGYMCQNGNNLDLNNCSFKYACTIIRNLRINFFLILCIVFGYRLFNIHSLLGFFNLQ